MSREVTLDYRLNQQLRSPQGNSRFTGSESGAGTPRGLWAGTSGDIGKCLDVDRLCGHNCQDALMVRHRL